MKALSKSRLCLVGALILGLVFAWANAVPKVTSGEIFGGANVALHLKKIFFTRLTT